MFRTYNASFTLQNQLDELTEDSMTVPEKLLAYNRANRAVAILCNHQRAVPKTHDKSMENLREKIRLKREQIADVQSDLKVRKNDNFNDNLLTFHLSGHQTWIRQRSHRQGEEEEAVGAVKGSTGQA